MSTAPLDSSASVEERAAFFQFISLADLKVGFFTFATVEQSGRLIASS